MKKLIIFCVIGLLLTGCCSKSDNACEWVRGADISWLSEMEHDGMLFYNAKGEPDDCISLMRGMGMNAVRLRVWVNHKTGWSNNWQQTACREHVPIRW